VRRPAAILLLLLAAGCGTLEDLSGDRSALGRSDGPAPHVFGGVRLDLCKSAPDPVARPYWCLRWLDLPLSLALDVVILPLSVPVSLFSGPPTAPRKAEEPPTQKQAARP
jgi:hypothetical protein